MMDDVGNQIVWKGRKEISVQGIKELLRFDDASAEFMTLDGDLLISGEGIRVSGLDLEHGSVNIQAESVDAVEYLAPERKESPSAWKRLFSHS